MELKTVSHPDIIEDNEYLVSEDGRVFSTKTNRALLQFNKDGYKFVELFNASKSGDRGKSYPVHQLVMYTFNGYPPKDMHDPTVDHINNDRTDNSCSNLQWLSRSDNSRKTKYSRRRLTDGEVAKIIKKYAIDFDTIESIANELNIETSSVKDILISAEIPIRTMSETTTGFTKENYDAMVDEYNSGKTISELSKQYGLNTSTVNYQIKLRNDLRPRGYDNRKFTDSDEKEMIKLYTEDKLGSTTIAERFKTYDTTVLSILKRNNIPIRTLSESMKLSSTNKLGDDIIDKICVDFEKGDSLRDLSRKYGVRPLTIRRYLELNGKYKPRTNQELALKSHGITPEFEERICNRYLETRNAYIVANEFGISDRSVYSCLKRNNIQIQNKSEAAYEGWRIKREKESSHFMYTPLIDPIGISPFDINKEDEYSSLLDPIGLSPFDI